MHGRQYTKLTPADAATDLATLSKRELAVLSLIATGSTYDEIACRLSIAVGTVQNHIKKIYAKLSVHSRSKAVFEAHRRGLLIVADEGGSNGDYMDALHNVLEGRPANSSPEILSAFWFDLFPDGLLAELHAHPFLYACRSGEADRDLLRSFLIQHQYYAQYFTRYLCAIMASLPLQRDVRSIAENLFEEMGFDDGGTATHADLYLQTMAAMGAAPASEPILPETQNLINAMFQYCRSHDPLDGLAALCLGAEAIAPVIYDAVLTALENADVPPAGLTFFELHVMGDEKHAIVMRVIIDNLLEKHPYRRLKTQAIAQDMVRMRMATYDAILSQHLKHAV